MSILDVEISTNAHELYAEYKKLDKEFYDALNAAKSRFADPFDDEETVNYLRELDDRALEGFYKWRAYRDKHSSKLDFS